MQVFKSRKTLLAIIGLSIVGFVLPYIFSNTEMEGTIILIVTITTVLTIVILPSLFKLTYLWINVDRQSYETTYLPYETIAPENILSVVQEIKELGFTKLGAKRIEYNPKKPAQDIWVWIDETHTILAFLSQYTVTQPFVSFQTNFNDKFMVETIWKINLQINRPNMIVNAVNGSIQETFHFHTHLIDEYEDVHLGFKHFDSLESTDFCEQEDKYVIKQVFESNVRKIGRRVAARTFIVISALFYYSLLPINEPLEVLAIFILSVIVVFAIQEQIVDSRISRKPHPKSLYN